MVIGFMSFGGMLTGGDDATAEVTEVATVLPVKELSNTESSAAVPSEPELEVNETIE